MLEKISSEVINKNKSKIDFVEETHTYFVDGKRLPSVSEIMRPLTKEYYDGIDKNVLDIASRRGLQVHRMIEVYELFDIEEENELKPYLLNYKIAKNIEKFIVNNMEVMFTNDEFCGTVDIIATIDNEIVLIDLKATSKINTQLLECQLAGYNELLKHNGINVKKHYVLHLTKKGMKFKEIVPNFEMWEVLKNMWKKDNESL